MRPSLRALAVVSLALPLFAQKSTGELRLQVRDRAGAGVAAMAELLNVSTKTRQSVELPSDGRYVFKNLPFGFYRLRVERSGFVASSELVEIRSELPRDRTVTLGIRPFESEVTVTESDTLVDPNRTGVAYYVGTKEISERPSTQPGRGLIDLAVMQPGWTLEANGILHPRESEYDTQFVVNGFPLQENRSPAFAPTVDADTVESMKLYTSGIPAEFGDKLGGVIEITTDRNLSPGFHGVAVAQGGSFGTAGGYLSGQYVTAKTTTTLSAEGFLTDRYLDPPVTANFSNHASSTSFTGTIERDLTSADRLRVSATRREVWFLVPNDLLQNAAGQRQDRTSGDTEGQVSYQHVFSPHLVGDIRGMARDIFATLWSNPLSTPIAAHQDRDYREGYINGSFAGHYGRHEWKAGAEARFASVREEFGYAIGSYDINGTPVFDPGIPPTFEFSDRAPRREEAAYVQDTMRFGNLTVSAGLRFDHYRLLTSDSGLSPRLGLSWMLRPLGLVLHASYDRTFGTPPFENILVSAAPPTRFDGGFYLPIQPSRGNYYEAGFTRAIGGKARLDASYFRRDIRDFEDDDLLLNTGVSFPIAFHIAEIRGVEVKLDVPRWGPFSGYMSYANTIGFGQLPISGGLFLDQGSADLLSATDRFPISQDQRNTARAALRYQVRQRLWTSWTAVYSSGLPVEDAEDLPDLSFLAAEYGASVVQRVNFSRGRVAPSFALNASAGVDLWRREHRSMTFQADVLNIANRLNVIDFAGLLSGTALGPPRSFGLRLRTEF